MKLRSAGLWAAICAGACGGAGHEALVVVATTPPPVRPTTTSTAPTLPPQTPSPKGTIVFRPFVPAGNLPARRPLVPQPSAPPPPSGKGTVDESGDETKLVDVLIGSAAIGKEKDSAIDTDVDAVSDGVRLVLDSPYQMFSKTGTYVHVAAYLPTFAPAASARVFVDGKLAGRTDATGTFVFRDVPKDVYGNGQHNLSVIAGTGTTRSKGGATYTAFARTHSFERANLYVYTDRGVFAPGDTVHVRAFAWRLRGDYRPFADAAVNVLLRKDGKVFSGGRIATDKMGIAWLDLPLPSTIPEGSYELAVEHLGERATARLQVKRILAPVFKIDHTVPRFLAREAKPIAFDVKIASATGDPLKSTMLVARAVDPSGKLVWTESRKVTTPGPHKLVIPGEYVKLLHTGFGEGALASVTIEATDEASGRRDELKRDLRIATAPYRLVVESDRNEHVTGETIKVVVHATDLEQSPASGEEIEIAMKGPGTDTKLTVKSDADGLAKATFVMPAAAVTLEATLVKAKAVKGFGYIQNSPPRAMFADIPVPSVVERAATPIEVRFPSSWAPAEKVVHADVVDSSGALIHAFLLPIAKQGTTWIAKGSFPAPSWGSMLITFFAIGAEEKELGKPDKVGLLTDGANLPVSASRPITVTLKAPTSVAPGAKFDLEVSLARAWTGAPKDRPFALGAAITEDAFVALLDPLERTPHGVLYNPERKVMATTGSQILSWPVVQRTWGAGTYDIALPPFGFRMGGPQLPAVIHKPQPVTPPVVAANGAGGAPKPGDVDGDGIPDAQDKCPNEPETYNGYQDDDGCPDKGKVVITSNDIKIMPQAAASASPAPAFAGTLGALPALPPPPPKEPALKKPPVGHDDVKITIRTEFSPTSLWIPERILEPGKDGIASVKIPAQLSDSITTQRVTVVASDDRGATGIGKALIKVDQDVSVRSDVPAVLTQGDEVEVAVAVRNTRKDAVAGTVTLSSTGIALAAGTTSQTITVAAGSTSAAKFRVRATAAGKIPFTVSFAESRPAGSPSTTPLRNDREDRTVWVRPRGVPIETKQTGKLSSSDSLSFFVVRNKDDAHVEADLAIAFPSAVPLLEGLEDLVSENAYLGVDPDSSRLLAAIAVEGYLLRTKAPASTIARVHQQLLLGATDLLIEQQQDGGWGWRWDQFAAKNGLGSATSPYVTSHALLALAKLRETDVPIPDSAITAARAYLLKLIEQSGGHVDVSNVAFWEGDGLSRQRAATMSAFHAIAASERTTPPSTYESNKIDSLATAAEAIAKGGPGSEDPLTLSAAVMGLHLHAVARGTSANVRESTLAGVRTLVAAYRDSYWEPSWFHAFGGRIEATRGAIELLATVAPGVYDADLHDAVGYLLSTRPSWGAWHNSWGTAAAIEALTFLDPTPPEKSSASVTISVDGKSVKLVKIDPADPFTSAASLRSVDLASFLSVGKHEVRVAYDGALTVPVTATVRRYSPEKPKLLIEIERGLSGEISQGESTTSSVTIKTSAKYAEVMVSVPLPAGLEADARKMDALVQSGAIAAWRTSAGALSMSLSSPGVGAKKLDLPLRAIRKGTYTLSAIYAYVPRSEAEGYSAEGKIVIK